MKYIKKSTASKAKKAYVGTMKKKGKAAKGKKKAGY